MKIKPTSLLIIPGEPSLNEKEFKRLQMTSLYYLIVWVLLILMFFIYWAELNNVFKYIAVVVLGIFVPDFGSIKLSQMKYEAYISEWKRINQNTLEQ